MIRYLFAALLFCWCLAGPAGAADDAPEPPLFDGSGGVPADEAIEPSITIREEKDRTIREYRVNGRLYMVEIRPAKGKPYYLVDNDGDGELETRHKELGASFRIPSWVLLKW